MNKIHEHSLEIWSFLLHIVDNEPLHLKPSYVHQGQDNKHQESPKLKAYKKIMIKIKTR